MCVYVCVCVATYVPRSPFIHRDGCAGRGNRGWREAVDQLTTEEREKWPIRHEHVEYCTTQAWWSLKMKHIQAQTVSKDMRAICAQDMLCVWRTEDRTENIHYRCAFGRFTACSFSHDGEILAVGWCAPSTDRAVYILFYNMRSLPKMDMDLQHAFLDSNWCTKCRVPRLHRYIHSLSWYPDGSRLFADHLVVVPRAQELM